MQDFQSTNTELASFTLSVYVLGFGFSPLVIAPLSEMYARLPLYHACNVLFVAFTVACAVRTLIGFRFIVGCTGSAPLTLAAGTIPDTIEQERRGAAMSFLVMDTLLGPVIGLVISPVAGGYLCQVRGGEQYEFSLLILSRISLQTLRARQK